MMSSKRSLLVLFLLCFSLCQLCNGSQARMFSMEKVAVKSSENVPKGLLSRSHSYEVHNMNSVWVTQVVFGQNNVVPLAVMFFTNETWISSIDKENVKAMPCAGKCEISEGNVTIPMLTYKTTGPRAHLQKSYFIYASEFDYAPETLISGGLGLGIFKEENVTSFPLSFGDLDPVFAIYLSRNFLQSSNIMFGGYDSQYVVFNARFQKITALTKRNWTFQLNRVADQSLFAFTIFDPNLPYIGIPKTHYEWFLNNFTTQNKLSNCNYNLISPKCDCKNFKNLPALVFSLGGAILELPPSAYTSQSSNGCHLLVTRISSDNTTDYNTTGEYAGYWVLGEPFMTYYYMVFYGNEGYVNLAPSREISTTMAAWIIMILICSFGFIGIVLYRCYKLGPKAQKKEGDQKSINSKDLAEKLIKLPNQQSGTL